MTLSLLKIPKNRHKINNFLFLKSLNYQFSNFGLGRKGGEGG